MSIGLLVSGGLGLEALKHVTKHNKPVFVFTNKTSKAIVDYCLVKNIPVFIGNPRNRTTSKFLVDKTLIKVWQTIYPQKAESLSFLYVLSGWVLGNENQ